jgi:hypothetical protein
VTTADPLVNGRPLTLDGNGQFKAVRNPLGRRTSLVRYLMNRALAIIDPPGRRPGVVCDGCCARVAA